MNIGILNAGGDCPGLNAVIEGAVAAASARGWTVYGFYDGFEGLLSTPENERYRILTPQNCHNIRSTGGTILGTVNKGNFTVKSGVGGRLQIADDVLRRSKETVERLDLKALIVVGGDGSQTIGLELRHIGLPIVGVPKTIDNDLGATDYTFGFWTAVSVVSENLDRLRTTAFSHQRMMVVEVMGRHAGWIALYGGIAAFLSTKLETLTGIETRYCVLGHIQRGGDPIPFDRVLGVRCGAKAIDLIEEGKFGDTVALSRNDMVSMPIEEAVRTLHLVDIQSQIVTAAKEIGISFGDESLQLKQAAQN